MNAGQTLFDSQTAVIGRIRQSVAELIKPPLDILQDGFTTYERPVRDPATGAIMKDTAGNPLMEPAKGPKFEARAEIKEIGKTANGQDGKPIATADFQEIFKAGADGKPTNAVDRKGVSSITSIKDIQAILKGEADGRYWLKVAYNDLVTGKPRVEHVNVKLENGKIYMDKLSIDVLNDAKTGYDKLSYAIGILNPATPELVAVGGVKFGIFSKEARLMKSFNTEIANIAKALDKNFWTFERGEKNQTRVVFEGLLLKKGKKAYCLNR